MYDLSGAGVIPLQADRAATGVRDIADGLICGGVIVPGVELQGAVEEGNRGRIGPSIRIHRGDVQKRVFSLMGLGEEEAQEKFGFLLDAFAFGPPPHGGIAFGWDRIVMLLSGTSSLREVIAFPKSGGGYDPLTGAPAAITPAQRKEAGIDARPAAPKSVAKAEVPPAPEEPSGE